MADKFLGNLENPLDVDGTENLGESEPNEALNKAYEVFKSESKHRSMLDFYEWIMKNSPGQIV
jgi:CHAD domain-containing protein